MRILSLNAWGGRLRDRLMRYLREADPDIVCLQEVVQTPTAEAEWLVYRDHDVELPQRANLFREVADIFPSHQSFFCPAARGSLYDGERNFPSEWGLATFVRRSYPVIGQVQDFVHGDFAPDGWGEHPRARNAHVVRLFDYGAAAPITIAHMHGLRDPAGKEDTPARHAQARALADLIGSVRQAGDRLVVCGDFNVLPDSSTFAVLGALGLTDLVTMHGHTDTRTSYYRKSPRFADYMLVSADIPVRRFDVVQEPEVSDHRVLLLELD
ncbi:endonuclease/exonuclease/phosphatase family protein [Chelativorans sp. AA-79]|uniref:endonuclease/exonuclease/phosphatase family protein n=1 Tax=Chelativorans sp. AA-79 TaxID=3028735 RepID=UPI0023F77CDA|nr:endonuclease/exonuclease/phosphatase family protein [Chelativorans sp. AA-79]WEX08201.1 endonuclease/exonuclease/phosphatase family protein [Chelativorans sp. AA-79]